MRNIKRRAMALLVALCAVVGLTACGGGEKDVTALVQGNIDLIYMGKYDADYLKMVGSTEEEAEAEYLAGLEIEAEYFAHYWGIVDASLGESYYDLDESLRNDIIELYKEIYSHSKYEVQEAVKQGDGSYAVKVLIDPIDIMERSGELYDNDEYGPLTDFWEKHVDSDYSMMTYEEQAAYTHEYGEIIVQMVRDQLPNLGYTEQKSQSIQVEESNGVLSINNDDWGIFDSYVIYYP